MGTIASVMRNGSEPSPLSQMELDLYRLVHRVHDSDEAIFKFSSILGATTPVIGLRVIAIDLRTGRVAGVAPSCGTATPTNGASTDAVDPQQLLQLFERTGRLVHGTEAAAPALSPVFGATPRSSAVLGALTTRGELVGIAVFELAGPRPLRPAERVSLELSLEPLTTLLLSAAAQRRATHAPESVRAAARLDRDVIVGASSGLRAVMDRVDQVARGKAPVLVLGETGSGKDVIARAIHERSPRSESPLVKVDCGAIAPEWVDSELFGHDRGSLTGALTTRQGWFERADGGTLILDDVGALPLSVQVRLLRVLQEGTFERVGGQRALQVDVRVIATTNRDLTELVECGRFRRDLWYRLKVFPLRVPPLRDRLEDLEPLARYFAERLAPRSAEEVLAPTPADLALLRAHGWLGNVRELAAVIERAVILGGGTSLDVGGALSFQPDEQPPESNTARTHTPEPTSVRSLNEVIIEHIGRALTATRGRIEGPHGAAALLAINPHTLRARMRKYGIDWARYRASGGSEAPSSEPPPPRSSDEGAEVDDEGDR